MKKGNPGHSSLSPNIVSALNKQIYLEAQASFNYLAMAAWCSAHGYDNSADFFFAQSDEERVHMLKIFKYICDMGGEAVAPSVTEKKPEFSSLKEVFELALESEMNVSGAINEIVDLVRKEKDYPTENFIQWFVEEQIEEEYIVRRAVELFDLLGDDKLAIFMIDERIPKIAYSNTNTTNQGV